jgi:predicted acyltransferase
VSITSGQGIEQAKLRGGSGTGTRIASVDALRGLTILLMVFVNDLGRGAPAWLHHIQPPDADGMTLADVVFPAFLFIVGLSIPLAFERAKAAGRSRFGQLGHILARSAILLLMGVVVLNSEEERSLAKPPWTALVFTALILAWIALPREQGRKRRFVLAFKVLGFAGLLTLLAVYRGAPVTAEIPFWGPVDNWVWLRTGWWGILGLIGWAYLTVGILFLLLGWRREWLMGALAMLMLLHLTFNQGDLLAHVDSKPWLGPSAYVLHSLARVIDDVANFVSLRDATGSLAAITMAGCLLGTILRTDSDVQGHRQRIVWALTFACGLLLAGCLTDTFEGINKIAATPTWCLWSAALTCLTWIVLYCLLDMLRIGGWDLVLRGAGANPLVAYFLHPIIVELLGLTALGTSLLTYKEAAEPWLVVAGSAAMAVVVCAIAAGLGRMGLQMRL